MNELIRDLVEALVSETATVERLAKRSGFGFSDPHSALLAKARAYLETGGWARVEDGLPVVPDGDPHVNVWICLSEEGHILRTIWARGDDREMFPQMTHWRYAEPTPKPPKG